jgi:glycosyltransferase involved in cell wall biosynthesis
MRKVSVIIPNYNHHRFIGQRIESVLNQTYSDFDLLILDDMSSDNSREIIEQYRRDPRVSIEYNTQNSGSTYLQWKKGIAHTNSEYIWIAESDDYADRTFLSCLVEKLDAHPRAGLAVCESVIVDEANNEVGIYGRDFQMGSGFSAFLSPVIHRDFAESGRDYCRNHMVPWNTVPNASAVLFRRSALVDIGGPVTEMRLCGDWLTYCKILMQFDICRESRTLNYFRTHVSNVRSHTKTTVYMAEQRQVRAYVQRALGVREKWRFTMPLLKFESELLISGERRLPSKKVPSRRLLSVLSRAAEYGFLLLSYTAVVLLKEQLAMLIKTPVKDRLGGRC